MIDPTQILLEVSLVMLNFFRLKTDLARVEKMFLKKDTFMQSIMQSLIVQ